MTVNRFRDGEFAKVRQVGKPLDDASVKVRRDGEWDEIWPGVTVVEDFERGNLDPYEGDLGAYSVEGEGAFEGDNYLATVGSGFDRIRSTSGLPAYPKSGDTFTYYQYLDSDSDADQRFRFAVQDRDSNYGIQIQEDSFAIFIREAGDFTSLSATSANPVRGEWIRVTVDWSEDGDIEATLYDDAEGHTEQATVLVVDETFKDGGIGFSHNRSGDHRWDYVVIHG